MVPVVVALEHVEQHRIRVRFADGLEGEVDVAELVDFVGVFADLRDPASFRLAFVDEDSGTVAWPGGADIDPLVLYATVKRIDPARFVAAMEHVSD